MLHPSLCCLTLFLIPAGAIPNQPSDDWAFLYIFSCCQSHRRVRIVRIAKPRNTLTEGCLDCVNGLNSRPRALRMQGHHVGAITRLALWRLFVAQTMWTFRAAFSLLLAPKYAIRPPSNTRYPTSREPFAKKALLGCLSSVERCEVNEASRSNQVGTIGNLRGHFAMRFRFDPSLPGGTPGATLIFSSKYHRQWSPS